MIACYRIRRRIPALLSEELKSEEKIRVEKHIRRCRRCRREYEEAADLFEKASVLDSEIRRVMDEVDWASLPEKIAAGVPAAAAEKRTVSTGQGPGFFLALRWKPIAAGLAAGILIGGAAVFYLLRPAPTAGPAFNIPSGFLERAEMEMARRDTMDYLDRSRFLLLDFIQSRPGDPAVSGSGEFSAEKARFLLSKKKYINRHLEKFQMAKAKAICDQIEVLFLELIRISEDLSPGEIRAVQNLIEKQQILLKIKLVQKELENNEKTHKI